MLNYVEGDFKAGQIKIYFYRTGGNKPPLILLHGATDNGLCWTRVAEVLAREYDVIMPDAQGHGFSDRIDSNFSYNNHTDQVIELTRYLKITKPIIMGHSMGAGTAVNVAIKQPDLPQAIILEDPGWQKEQLDMSPNSDAVRQRNAFIMIVTGYRQHTQEEVMAECRKANPRWSEVEITPWAKAKKQFDPALFSKPFIRPSYAEQVPQIQCPTLLITSDGGIVSAEVAEHAARLWKSSKPFRHVRINGAGHNIRREQFEAFMDAVARFLKEVA